MSFMKKGKKLALSILMNLVQASTPAPKNQQEIVQKIQTL